MVSVTNDHIARKTMAIPSITSTNIQIHGQSHNLSHSLLSDKTFREALLVVLLFVALPFVSGISLNTWLTQVLYAFFESVSASTNTGLSIGLTNVELDSISKSILIINMIMGRFEIITILYIFFSFLRR